MELTADDDHAADGEGRSVVLDGATIERLRSLLRCQSKECVMETLGVSSPTWTKMKRRQPVSRYLVERALQRADVVSHRGVSNGT